ncbi:MULTISPECIES: hypothetical protein [unclassified Lacinutrix]
MGQTEKKNSEASNNQELQLEFNVMQNIALKKNKKYENEKQYELVENGIYRDLNSKEDAIYLMTISYQLELDETNNQYPLEDILDKYLIHVSDSMESENKPNTNTYTLELGGYLAELKKAKEIIGKKVFNREYKGRDGKIRVILVIE